jgi:hypothetical protein
VDGSIEVKVTFSEESVPLIENFVDPVPLAQVAVAREADSGYVLSVGFGGDTFASVLEFNGVNWATLASIGQRVNIVLGHKYSVRVAMQGQVLKLEVDGSDVIAYRIAFPPRGRQVGVVAQGRNKVLFEDFQVVSSMPFAFAAMEFNLQFDALYQDVLKPAAAKFKINLIRADEIPGPGFIIADIVKNLVDATVVVAEITRANANVFFELGYAYAFHKPLILLAEKDSKLPFDVSGMRVIFYEDSIAGKTRVEQEFERHLGFILGTS